MKYGLTISIEEKLVKKIDKERGLIPRSRYIENELMKSFPKQSGQDE